MDVGVKDSHREVMPKDSQTLPAGSKREVLQTPHVGLVQLGTHVGEIPFQVVTVAPPTEVERPYI